MGKEIIAIAFSDLHQELWKQHNENIDRLGITTSILRVIADEAYRNNCPVLFPGDLYHNNTYLHQRVIEESFISYKILFEDRNIPFYAISGNHDLSQKNWVDKPSLSYLTTYSKLFKTFHLMDWRIEETPNFMIRGIPYMNGNKDMGELIKQGLNKKAYPKPCILLLHTDLHGALDSDGREVGEVENIPKDMDKFFKDYKLVLSGHIHKPHKFSDKIYMLGATNHQKTSDAGCDMGYWVIYKDFTMEFRKLNTPEFIYLPEGEEAPNKENFYITTYKPKEGDKKDGDFNSNSSPTVLAKRYLKHKGIKSKDKRRTLINLLND